ncbi:hypothetical protein PHJA_002096100 [Phtheirospermum japonicum]|uniref:Knottins-like domain-containing protein n=1 Tax=Phtheirospermum japonicum TaxID=374723 RepID=A0A830CIF4_9LAMI|nr:hypothetical protein PHJA_002096100 [Phtheirospermum japonicum]
MIHAEARICYTKSKLFSGKCFYKHQINNCKIACKLEKFTNGKCIHGTCYCSKKCGTTGGHPAPRTPPSDNEEHNGGGDEYAPPMH